MSRHGSTYISIVERNNGRKVYRKHQAFVTWGQLFRIPPGVPQYPFHGRDMENLE